MHMSFEHCEEFTIEIFIFTHVKNGKGIKTFAASSVFRSTILEEPKLPSMID